MQRLRGLTLMGLLVNQEKSLVAGNCSCVSTLGTSFARECIGLIFNFRIVTPREEIN